MSTERLLYWIIKLLFVLCHIGIHSYKTPGIGMLERMESEFEDEYES